jgi:hypothetical protein
MTDKKDDPELDALLDRYGMKPSAAPEKKAAPKAEAPTQASVPIAEVIEEPLPYRGDAVLAAQEALEEAERNKTPENILERNRGLAETGAVLGGMAQYKGVGQNLFSPSSNVFAPRDANLVGGQKSNLMPLTGEPLSDVQHTMQSGQGQRPGETGRQREGTHNQETNRQALALKQNINAPGAERAIVDAGPMYTTKSGIPIPVRAANQIEQELQIKQMLSDMARQKALEESEKEQKRVQKQQENRAKVIGGAKGTAKIGQGIVGGAIAAPQLYEYGRDVVSGAPGKSADTTQGLSGLGALMMALGKGKAGFLGGLAQIPYAVKHKDELARGLKLADIVPDTVRMGMTGSEVFEPADTMPRPPPSFTYGVKN